MAENDETTSNELDQTEVIDSENNAEELTEEEIKPRKPSKPVVVATYRVPEKNKNSHNRLFFWLFMFSILLFGVTSAISLPIAIKSSVIKREYENYFEYGLGIDNFEYSFDGEIKNRKNQTSNRLVLKFNFKGALGSCFDEKVFIKIIQPNSTIRDSSKNVPANFSMSTTIDYQRKELTDINISPYFQGKYLIEFYYQGKIKFATYSILVY